MVYEGKRRKRVAEAASEKQEDTVYDGHERDEEHVRQETTQGGEEERSVVDKIREKLKRKAPSAVEVDTSCAGRRQKLVVEERESGRKRMMINTVGRGVDGRSLQKAVTATYKRLQSREKAKHKKTRAHAHSLA